MSNEAKLVVEPRTEMGSANCRRLRKRGLVPGNVYGHNAAAMAVVVSADVLNPVIKSGSRVVDLEVAGAIVKTNAEYVTGSRLTLLEMDMDSLLADEAKLKALQGKLGADASLSAVKPYLKDIKGIKIDGPTISVEFK